jgi:tripartite-type tricarboxylate transporter receptor subunit TctC
MSGASLRFKIISSGNSMLSRRAFVASSLATVAGAIHAASAQTPWPTNTINVIVPFPAGGTVDQLSRLMQAGLQQRLGTTLIVENKPGAQGSLGTGQVARAKPDGGTWVMVFDTHAVNPSLQTLNFDTEKDLAPVLLVGTAPHILCTHPNRPWKSFADVLAAAKKDPGKLTYGSIGTGSIGHLTMVLLTKKAGIEMTHVPFRGGGPLLNDALAGHVDFSIASTALVNPQIAANGLKPVLQTGAQRLAVVKDIPTAIEAGFAGFESYAWWGAFAPKGTPEPLIARMREAMVATLKEPTIAAQLADNMQMTATFGDAAALSDWVTKQVKIWGDVVRENGIKAGQ